ncbi:MAG: glycosyltransferase family 2 protein [Saccharofermentanales bacterium]
MKTLIVIPAFNESGNLPKLLRKIEIELAECDVLVINDCSTDETEKIVRERNHNVICLPINLGIGGAVQTGFKYADLHGYDIVVQVDGDGQHNPEYIREMISKIDDGYNVCIGSRFIDNEGYQSTNIRRIGIIFYRFLLKLLTGHSFTDPTSGFRAFNRQAIQYFSKTYPVDYAEPESIIMLFKKMMTIVEIPVIMNEREKGKSSIGSLNSVYFTIKVTLAICIASLTKRRL